MQRAPVFFVEKALDRPTKKQKVDGSGDDKQPDSRKGTKATKKSVTAGSTGQDSRNTDNPPKKRKSTSQAKEDGQVGSSKGGQKAAKTEHVTEREADTEAGKPASAKEPSGQDVPQGVEKTEDVQGPPQDETRDAEGTCTEGGKVQRAPLSDQRKAQLEAARKRANEVRKQKHEERQRQKKIKDELFQKYQDAKSAEAEAAVMRKMGTNTEKIPDVLPQPPPPKYVSEPENAPAIDIPVDELPRMRVDMSQAPRMTQQPPRDLPVAQADNKNWTAPPPPPVALRDADDQEPRRKKKLKWSRKAYETDSSDDEEDEYMETIMRNRKIAKLIRKDRANKRNVNTKHLQQRPSDGGEDDVAYLHNMSKARRDMLMQAVFGC